MDGLARFALVVSNWQPMEFLGTPRAPIEIKTNKIRRKVPCQA